MATTESTMRPPPVSSASSDRTDLQTLMPIHERRVLRRKATLIAEVMILDRSVASSIIRQGLLKPHLINAIMAESNNLVRVVHFLEQLEETGPATFEKLCFLIENLGYSWLSDELIVELVCEKGNLEIDWTVMAEARAIVRQRMGPRRKLEDEDFQELTMLIATRYQVAKETYLRQEKRLANYKARNKRQLKDNLRELCVQIESAMSDHVPAEGSSSLSGRLSRSNSQGGPMGPSGRTSSRRTPGSHPPSHLSAQEIANLSSATAEPGMSNWMGLLKNRIENLTSAYSTVSTTLAVKEQEVALKEKAELIAKQELDREKNKARFKLPSDSSAGTAEMSPIDKIAADLNARDKAEKLRQRTAQPASLSSKHATASGNSSVFTHDKSQKLDPSKFRQRKPSKSTISALPNFQNPERQARKESFDNGRAGSRLGRKSDSSLVRGNKSSLSRNQKRPANPGKETSKYKEITIDPEEAQQVKNQIRNDAIKLKRMNRTLEHMRKVIGNDGPNEGFKKMEAQYWKTRCDILRKSKSLGYYYFLSEHQRERCEPCHIDPTKEVPMTESKPTIPASKYCKNLSFLAYESPSRVVPDQRSVTFKGDIVEPEKIMTEHYFLPHEERKAIFPQEFNDEGCPGATTMADGRRRCIACASANKDLPNFYDGLVAPHGEHHFYIPPLVAAEVSTDRRHNALRKLVTGPAIGQMNINDAVVSHGSMTNLLLVATV